MVFSSLVFLLFFLPALLLVYYLVPARFRGLRNLILLGASLFFYWWGAGPLVLLMVLSISVNYVGGLLAGQRDRPRLARAGLPLYATALGEDTQDIRTLPLGRAAVVIGSEGRGVSPAVLAASEKTLQIPMTERCESLNAAAAGTVVLWQMGFGPVG